MRIPRGAALLAVALAIAAASGCAKREPPASRPDGAASPAARPSRLLALLPSVLLAGETSELAVVPLTDIGLLDPNWSGVLTLEAGDAFQRPNAFEPNGQGAFVLRPVSFFSPGIHRVTIRSDGGLEAIAGPVLVVSSDEKLRPRAGAEALRIAWGDAHGHSTVGDGANSPEVYFAYAREVARLDFTCLSEHDFQQFLDVGLDEDSTAWDRISDLARTWRRPGFAVLLGWEWSSRDWGHRVVLFPDDASRWVSYRTASTPQELANAVRSTGAISFLAHPKGSELTPAVRWDGVVPGFDVGVEIYSGHGGMDEDAAFRPTTKPEPSASAMEALARDIPLAFVAFSDTHLSTPGNPFAPAIRDAPYPGGLTAVWTSAVTERGVFAGLRAKRTYATSGERFLVDVRVADRVPGESTTVRRGERVRVTGRVAAARALERVEILRGTDVAMRVDVRGQPEIELRAEVGPFDGAAAIWVRGESKDGERFWTTPVWVAPE